jgi:hypothetical protein
VLLAKSGIKVVIMRIDDVFLLFPGLWVLATEESGNEPETHSMGRRSSCLTLMQPINIIYSKFKC